MFLAKDSRIFYVLNEKQTFYAVDAPIPESIEKKIIQHQADTEAVQKYLREVAGALASRVPSPLKNLEVPKCLDEPVVVKEPKPKKKVTAARSSSKSQVKRKATQSKSSTSPPKPE